MSDGFSDVFKDGDHTNGPVHPTTVKRLMEYMQTAPGQDLPGRNMTLWGAINAVTYWIDHEKGRTPDALGQNVLMRRHDIYKQCALGLAQEYVNG